MHQVDKAPRPELAAAPKVAVLLATKDGEPYIEEQLESIARQSHRNWILEASDDGSSDATLALLERFRARFAGRVRIHLGPRRGFAANFLSLVFNPSVRSDLYAYCDQDDVWDADKLARAIDCLAGCRQGAPALYCGRSRLIDDMGRPVGLSPACPLAPGFRNALVQNIAGGNTMVFNAPARELLISGGMPDVDLHDWWTYLVVSACGGIVTYDPKPAIGYRQHRTNSIGSPNRSRDLRARYRRLTSGHFRRANERNLRALAPFAARMPAEYRTVLEHFSDGRSAQPIVRLVKILRSGVYRQSALGNCALAAAAILGKI